MSNKIYQIKVTLRDSRPSIYRTILIESDTSLAQLHRIIQVLMNWRDCHLHVFRGKGIPVHDFSGWEEPVDETKLKLDTYLRTEKDKIRYEYDFGDSWECDIVLEKILEKDNKTYPVCLRGKRMAPVEDCGGIDGWYDLLETLKRPEHEEYDEMKAWAYSQCGVEEFDVDTFSLSTINEQLAKRPTVYINSSP